LEIIIIAAVSKNNVIGHSGKIPWHIKEELIHFKNSTAGFPIVMGRKTFESLKKPLENRLNIVLSRNPGFSFSHPNVVICNSVSEALDFCIRKNENKVFVIGGEEIFHQTINLACKMIISEVDITAEGDRFFPEIIMSGWEIESVEERNGFRIKNYKRIVE